MRVQDIFVLTQEILEGYFGVKHGTYMEHTKRMRNDFFFFFFFPQVKYV